MYDFTGGEFGENLSRVDNLIGAYEELEQNGVGVEQVRKDVLRAAVVFLHGSLEEVVRNLFLFRLPSGSSSQLDKIPFVGHDLTRRPKEILLGELKAYSGKFVENVISDSINRYVDTLNVNGADQLVGFLRMAEIQVEPFQRYLPALNSLMARRHQIVHQMDRTNDLDPLAEAVTDIDLQAVVSWRDELKGFVGDLMQLMARDIAD